MEQEATYAEGKSSSCRRKERPIYTQKRKEGSWERAVTEEGAVYLTLKAGAICAGKKELLRLREERLR